ncbi:hypothetical protein E4U24_007342 [Claviceps purpurea]|nr:hypothetical protein E4U24_007342 [Claviceps purpurea]
MWAPLPDGSPTLTVATGQPDDSNNSGPHLQYCTRHEANCEAGGARVHVSSGFTLKKTKKKHRRYAAELAKKMVWFLEPALFFPPKKLSAKKDKKDEKPISSTKDMKQTLEHYKISYWTLIALKWLKIKTGVVHASDSPILKDEDCELRPDLDAHWQELNRLQVGDPKRFLASAFGNQKFEWATLCASILEQ